MKSARPFFLALGILTCLIYAPASQASSKEFEILLKSPAARYILSELGAPYVVELGTPRAELFIQWVERHGLEMHLLEIQEVYKSRYPHDAHIFERRKGFGPDANDRLSLAQEEALSSVLREYSGKLLEPHVGEIVPSTDAPVGFQALAERLLFGSNVVSPKGGVYPIQSSREDLFAGLIHRATFDRRSMNPRYLLKSRGFEEGSIRIALENLPDFFAPLGFRKIIVDGRVWYEFPDDHALNSRTVFYRNFTGDSDPFFGNFQFESYPGGEAPILVFSERIARKTVVVGTDGRTLKHDILVHGLPFSRLIHRIAADNIANRFSLALDMYNDPRIAECGSCQVFFEKVLEKWTYVLERQSSILLPELIDARRIGGDKAFVRTASRINYALMKSQEGLRHDLGDYIVMFEVGKPPKLPKSGKYLEDSELKLIRQVVAENDARIRSIAPSEENLGKLADQIGEELRTFLAPHWYGRAVRFPNR